MKKAILITTGLLLAACEQPEPETIIIKETETVVVEEMKSNCVGAINGIKFAERFWNTDADGNELSTLQIQVDACEKPYYEVQVDLIVGIEGGTRLPLSFSDLSAFQRPISINKEITGAKYGDLRTIEYRLTLTDADGQQTFYQGGQFLPFVAPSSQE